MIISKFKKEFILYSLSIGLDRGGMLIYLPLLSSVLGIEDYGNYNYIQVLTRLLFPLFCLNMYIGIIKVGAVDIREGLFLLRKFSAFTLGVTLLVGIILFVTADFIGGYLYLYVALLSGIESLQSMMLSYLRTAEKNIKYFIFVFIKTSLFLVVLYLLSFYYELSLYSILNIQISLLLSILFFYYLIIDSNSKKIPIRTILLFSLYLIPHGIAQWGMIASNRLFLKYFSSDLILGYFSVLFTLGSIALLVNSGISIVLPQHIIQNYKMWKTVSVVKKFFLQYSFIIILLFLLLLLCLYADKYFFKKLDIYDKGALDNFVYIYVGFYVLGYYYYYSNILFNLGKSKLIMLITFFSSVVSILVSAVSIYCFDLLGASLSLTFSYVLYAGLTAFFSCKVEKDIVSTVFPLMKILLFTIAVICLTYYLFVYEFRL